MTYVDGFVVPVPADKVEDYRALAEKAGKIWKEYGALDYKECLAEDTEDTGFCQTFPDAFGAKDNEVLFFSFITYKSREHRDEVNAKVMADPRISEGMDPANMPFDSKRMAYGGFKALVEF